VGACRFVIRHDGAPLIHATKHRLPAIHLRSLYAACDGSLTAQKALRAPQISSSARDAAELDHGRAGVQSDRGSPRPDRRNCVHQSLTQADGHDDDVAHPSLIAGWLTPYRLSRHRLCRVETATQLAVYLSHAARRRSGAAASQTPSAIAELALSTHGHTSMLREHCGRFPSPLIDNHIWQACGTRPRVRG
jgi:hypothetical protein